ncbi:hypothetical protein [Stappia sp. P2PMeth1]|uniref:hypothetical protein n=1 Tax=Stappia sp. P2PMeth1 TaxID=2003586 RepID=UPI00164504F1|nr:hypothetical protein [Stappia sp. P2PMeth1]
MRLKRRQIGATQFCEMQVGNGWKHLTGVAEVAAVLRAFDLPTDAENLLPYLQLPAAGRNTPTELGSRLPDADPGDGLPLLPVVPRSFRDHMLHEVHVINAARGMVRRLMPRA